MLDTRNISKAVINIGEFRDKVLGCWTGKNIGGTLGAPFEGKREMNDIHFYTQELRGNPAPNDDLDLQLVWLQAAEELGIYNVTPRILAERWVNSVSAPCNEYSVCKANISNGFYPPLSGSCNNDRWKFSNGAWIRSEIWACAFPGSPDEAALMAYNDACCDHCGEGIYAEIFTASMESAAFIVSDIRKLIEIALSKIPEGCRVARAVRLAAELFDRGEDFKRARNAVVKDSEDLGWFQAPVNLGFVVLGLLYGRGDFGKSVCLAVNCGDDTDCTGATAGAILGIIMGRSEIPKEWTEPIGETIKIAAINPLDMNIPQTLGELTERTVRLALSARYENPTLPRIVSEPSSVSADCLDGLKSSAAVEKRLWGRSPYELTFVFPSAELAVDYENGPFITPGVPKKLFLTVRGSTFSERLARLDFNLPGGWSAAPAAGVTFNCVKYCASRAEITLTPGPAAEPFVFVLLDLRFSGRAIPDAVYIPFQVSGAVNYNPSGHYHLSLDEKHRREARLKEISCSY